MSGAAIGGSVTGKIQGQNSRPGSVIAAEINHDQEIEMPPLPAEEHLELVSDSRRAILAVLNAKGRWGLCSKAFAAAFHLSPAR